MPHIGVVGSVNLDIVARTSHLPAPGETVGGASIERHPGGKGANQALAARRMGADVNLIACVGSDPTADEALHLLEADGVDLSRVERSTSLPTGIALIVVDDTGENQIVVASGANEALDPAAASALGFDGVICQFEVPETVVDATVESAGGFVCVNPAPARPLSGPVQKHADLIVVNEIENAQLDDSLADVRALVAVTAGADEARIISRGRVVARQRPPALQVVDTVGAGDTFVAALTVALIDGATLTEALRLACAAGSLATTRPGAQPSIPERSEVERLLQQM